jgi:hypothetical protein
MEVTIYIIFTGAIVLMTVSLIYAVRLKSIARGGKIGRTLRFLFAFIVVFLAGYAISPLIFQISKDVALLLTAVVFLLGAIFVLIVLHVIRTLILRVFQELDL